MNPAASIGVTAKATKDGLVITLPFNSPPKASKTGKTLIVAGTSGAVEADVKVNGKNVILNVNAYIYATDKGESAVAE